MMSATTNDDDEMDRLSRALRSRHGENGTRLSEGTARILANLARSAGLSRRQLNHLGGGRARQTTRTDRRRVTPSAKPRGRRIPRRRPRPVPVDRDGTDRRSLRERAERARHASERRSQHKRSMQDSYLTQMRVSHRVDDDSAPVPRDADEKSDEDERPLDPAELFSRVASEIEERRQFLSEMKRLKALSKDREAAVMEEIRVRVRELETIDRAMSSSST